MTAKASSRYRLLTAHAVLVALLCSLPHWVGIYVNHADYSPFSVSPSISALTFDETHAYAPPARRFMLSGRINAEVDNFEHQSMTAGIPFVPAAILGGMGWVFGSLEKAFIAADCIFPVLLFLLLYKMAGFLLLDCRLRLLVAWSTMVIPFGFLNSFWRGDDALIAPLEVTRTPQPEISFLVLTMAATLTGFALMKPQDRRWDIAAGIASGAVVYCYYFYAIAWGIALGILILCGVVWRAPHLWIKTTLTLGMMLLLSIPFALAAFRGRAQGGQTYLLARMGAYTHRPSLLSLLGAISLFSVLLVYGRKIRQKQALSLVFTALVAASLLGMNIQVLSGYETQPWHFWKRLGFPVSFFLISTMCAAFSEKKMALHVRSLRTAATAVLVFLILETAARLVHAGIVAAPYQRATDPKIALLTWVRSHILTGQVIGTSNPELILLIPALTGNYTYVPSGLRSLTQSQEIVNRYDEIACLLGLSQSEVEGAATIPNHLGHSEELLHVLGLTYTGDREVLRTFLQQYGEYSSSCAAPARRLDYLITPKTEIPASVKRFFPFARVLYRNSRYELLDLQTR